MAALQRLDQNFAPGSQRIRERHEQVGGKSRTAKVPSGSLTLKGPVKTKWLLRVH